MRSAEIFVLCTLIFLITQPVIAQDINETKNGWYVRLTNPLDSDASIAVRVWVNRNGVAPKMTPQWVGLGVIEPGKDDHDRTNSLELSEYIPTGKSSDWLNLTQYIQSRPGHQHYRAAAFFAVMSNPDQKDRLDLVAEVANRSGGPVVRSFEVHQQHAPLIGWNSWMQDGPYLPTLAILFPMDTSDAEGLQTVGDFVQEQYNYVRHLPKLGKRPQRIAFSCESFIGFAGMGPNRFNPKINPLRSNCQMWDNLFNTYYELGYNTLLGIAQEPGDVDILFQKGVQRRQVVRWGHDDPPLYSNKARELGLWDYIKWMSAGDEIELDLTGLAFSEIRRYALKEDLDEKPALRIDRLEKMDRSERIVIFDQLAVQTKKEWDRRFVAHLKGKGFKPDEFIRAEDEASTRGLSEDQKWSLVKLAPDYDPLAREVRFPRNRPKLLYEGGAFCYYLWAEFYRNLMEYTLKFYPPGTCIPANFTPGCQVDARMWVDFFRWGGLNTAWSEDWWWQMNYPGPQSVGYQLSALRLASTYTGNPFQFYCIPYEQPDSFERMMAYALAHGTKSIPNWVVVNTCFSGYGGNSLDMKGRGRETLRAVHNITQAVGKMDERMFEAYPVPAEVALLINRATNTWDCDGAGRVYGMKNTLNYFENKAIYMALRHAHIWVDLISDAEVHAGRLDNYKVLYIGGSYMERQTARAIKDWVEHGGVLVADAGTAIKDEYAEPLDELDVVFGITNRSHSDTNINTSPTKLQAEPRLSTISYKGHSIPVLIGLEIFEPTTAGVLGTFADGSPALVWNYYGRGKAVHWGSYLGLAYLAPAMIAKGYSDPWDYPTEFPEYLRKLMVWPALILAGIEPPVTTSHPLVEPILMEESAGKIIALINFSNSDQTVTVCMPRMFTGEKIKDADEGAIVESVFSGPLKVKLNTMLPVEEIKQYRGRIRVPIKTFEFLEID